MRHPGSDREPASGSPERSRGRLRRQPDGQGFYACSVRIWLSGGHSGGGSSRSQAHIWRERPRCRRRCGQSARISSGRTKSQTSRVDRRETAPATAARYQSPPALLGCRGTACLRRVPPDSLRYNRDNETLQEETQLLLSVLGQGARFYPVRTPTSRGGLHPLRACDPGRDGNSIARISNLPVVTFDLHPAEILPAKPAAFARLHGKTSESRFRVSERLTGQC